MKKTGAYACFSLLVALAAILTQIPVSKPPLPRGRGSASFATPARVASQAAKQQLVEAYGRLPLSFEANQGQTDRSVKFLSRGNGYMLFLTSTEAVLSLNPSHDRKGVVAEPPLQDKTKPLALARGSDQATPEPAVLRMKLVGANPAPEVAGLDELPGKSNYFIGNDPAKWRTNVPTYAKVRYENVYPGIDLVYYGNQSQLEYDLVVAPGADPRAIRFAFQSRDREGAGNHPSRQRQQADNPSRDSNGAVPLRIDGQGDLVLETGDASNLRLRKPLIYQEAGGKRQEIAGGYTL